MVQSAKPNIPVENLVLEQPYYSDANGKNPYYFQSVAINRTIEAIARGENRILLVMATGTGKTYTAFQIIWKLWKSKKKNRILFLADRNILFLDKEFDGEPVMVYEPKEGEPIAPPENMGDNGNDFLGEEDDDTSTKRIKYYLDNVVVDAVATKTQFLDVDGQPITEDYQHPQKRRNYAN